MLCLRHRHAVSRDNDHTAGILQNKGRVFRTAGSDSSITQIFARPSCFAAEAAKDHIEEGPVHPFAHDVAEDRAGGADQRAGHDQRHVRQSEADTAGRPAGIAVQHGDYDGHVRAADRDND